MLLPVNYWHHTNFYKGKVWKKLLIATGYQLARLKFKKIEGRDRYVYIKKTAT